MKKQYSRVLGTIATVAGFSVLITPIINESFAHVKPSIKNAPQPGSEKYRVEMEDLADASANSYSNLMQNHTLENVGTADRANQVQMGRLFQVAPDLGTNAWTYITQYIQGSTDLIRTLTEYKKHAGESEIVRLERTAENLSRRVDTLKIAMRHGFSSSQMFNHLSNYVFTTNPTHSKPAQ